MHTSTTVNSKNKRSLQVTRWIIISLVFPTMLMPFNNGIDRVALPIIRDSFNIQPDMAAWVVTAFSLPYTILTPVYGRLSDGLGKRRLILIGSLLFVMGTTISVFSTNLIWLMAGRALQGVGTGGMMPMAMALISEIVNPARRGKVLGTWAITGPASASISVLVSGFIVENWGWRGALVPPLFLGCLAFYVIYTKLPAGLSARRPGFVRSFDWRGVGLLAAWMTSFLFYLSSRPITGVAPFQDWRLLGVTLLLAALLVRWEAQRNAVIVNPVPPDPMPFKETAPREALIDFRLFRIRSFNLATLCASLRLVVLQGLSFLMPLYLTDVRDLSPALIGFFIMLPIGAMITMVSVGGRLSDRWGSRLPTVVGLGIQGLMAIVMTLLPETTPLWIVAVIQILYGLGLGFALAALHHAALSHVPEAQMGSAAGLYSMFRFLGSAIGTAIAGVLLTTFLKQGQSPLSAYQSAFLFFAVPGFLGALIGFKLQEPKTSA